MITKEEIVLKLQGAGFKEERVEAVFFEVMQVIVGRALGNYLASLPEDTRAKLRGNQDQDLMKYIAEHKAELPEMSAADFEKVYEETWNEYFRAL